MKLQQVNPVLKVKKNRIVVLCSWFRGKRSNLTVRSLECVFLPHSPKVEEP
jgi:hypothetical protein